MKLRTLLVVLTLILAAVLLMANFAPSTVAQFSDGIVHHTGDDIRSLPSKRGVDDGAPSDESSARIKAEPSLALVLNHVEKGASLKSALSNVPVGEVQSNIDLASTVAMAATTCLEDPDPNAVTTSAGYDATKAWAVERLAELCDGFEAGEYRPTVKQVDYARIRLTSGLDTVASEAMRAIRQDNNYFGLVYGLTALVEAGKFPYEILPGGRKAYGPDALMNALSLGAQLQLCAERGGCGPNSMEVAAFCAAKGCRQDSTYERALRERMPPLEWEAIQAVRRWLSALRL